MSDITVAAFFTQSSGQPATGLALADIDLYLTEVDKSTLADTVIWDGTQNPTEEIDNVGAYARVYTGANLDDNDYFALATYTGAVGLDQDDVTGSVGINDAEVAAVWSYTTRTLTTAVNATGGVSGSSVTVVRGDSWSIAITGLGSVAGYTNLWFTVKTRRYEADTAALVQIDTTTGLLYINEAAAGTPANGSITVDDAGAGDITIALDEAESAKLTPAGGLRYDVQVLNGGDVTTLTMSDFTITADVTRATS
jgi:hypothetical protein